MSIDTMRSQRQTPVGAPPRRPTSAGGPATPPPEPGLPTITVGFGDLASWEFTQRVALGLASSSLVPTAYQRRTLNKRTGEWEDNPSAIPNCIIALNMANRIGADPLMVMQNLYIVEGRPSWSSQFVISAINSSGRFTSLQYRVRIDEEEQEVEYPVSEWVTDDRGKNVRRNRMVKTTVRGMSCVAFAKDKLTGEVLESPEVTMEMAVKEGWYGKNGSKWQTMPGLMIRYRSATFFGRLYAPELLMGLKTVEENEDIIEAQQNAEGVWEPVVEPEDGDGESAVVIEGEASVDATGSDDAAPATAQIEQKTEIPMANAAPQPQAEPAAASRPPAKKAAAPRSAPPQQHAEPPVDDLIPDPPADDDRDDTGPANLFDE